MKKFFPTVFVLLLAASPAQAVCGSGLNLILVTSSAVSFGNYDPGNGNSSNGAVQATCLLGDVLPSFTISLNGGTLNSFTPRKMSFLGATLNYNLYTTAGFGTVWGDGVSSGTVTQSFSTGANTGSKSFTVFGNAPANQFPSIGLYGDGVTVTITF